MNGLIAGEEVEMMLGTEQRGGDDKRCVTYPDFDFSKFEISRQSHGWRGRRRCEDDDASCEREAKSTLATGKTATQNDRLKVAS